MKRCKNRNTAERMMLGRQPPTGQPLLTGYSLVEPKDYA